MELFNEIIKHFTIVIVSLLFLTKIKSINFCFLKKVILYLSFILLSVFTFVLLTNAFNVTEPFRTTIVILISGIIYALFLKERIEIMLTAFTLTFALSYILVAITSLLSFFLSSPFLSPEPSDDEIRFIITGIVSIIAAILLRKIKMDFSSIFKKFASGIFLSISGLVIIFYGLIQDDISDESMHFLFMGFIALGYGIYSWLRRETTISKDENAKDVINKKQQEILNQKEKDFAVLKDMHDYLASVVHRDDKKLGAMQRAVEKLVMRSEQTDVLEDAQKILEEIQISKNKDEEDYYKKVRGDTPLPLTDMQIVDAKFETLSEKAMLKKVEFDFVMNGDISDFSKNILEYELSNIIGDLAENAFNAVQSLKHDQTCRKIKFVIDKNNTDYELSVSDSGIPFNIDVLLKLGNERITSRPNNGGSGYGYETIFGLLDEYGASLIITEYKPKQYDYSKKITVRFDGKSNYIIKSFRVYDLIKQDVNTRFVIKNLDDKTNLDLVSLQV